MKINLCASVAKKLDMLSRPSFQAKIEAHIGKERKWNECEFTSVYADARGLNKQNSDFAQCVSGAVSSRIPDGAPRTVSKNIKAQKITKFFFDDNKTVAAICHGPYTLISSGVVNGRKVTSFWGDGVPEELKKAGAEYEDTEVVVDKNLITSRYPMDLPLFLSKKII